MFNNFSENILIELVKWYSISYYKFSLSENSIELLEKVKRI